MNTTEKKTTSRIRRHARIRAKVKGTAERPRLAIYKSNRYISAQIINDENGTTLVALSSKGLAKGKDAPHATGKEIARLAKEKKIASVVFDRGGFIYTGRVKAFADGAREGGLAF